MVVSAGFPSKVRAKAAAKNSKARAKYYNQGLRLIFIISVE
jgi:hypothetical protein